MKAGSRFRSSGLGRPGLVLPLVSPPPTVRKWSLTGIWFRHGGSRAFGSGGRKKGREEREGGVCDPSPLFILGAFSGWGARPGFGRIAHVWLSRLSPRFPNNSPFPMPGSLGCIPRARTFPDHVGGPTVGKRGLRTARCRHCCVGDELFWSLVRHRRTLVERGLIAQLDSN